MATQNDTSTIKFMVTIKANKTKNKTKQNMLGLQKEFNLLIYRVQNHI